MKAAAYLALAAHIALGGFVPAQTQQSSSPSESHDKSASDRDRLIGGWHLVALRTQGADGKLNLAAGLTGKLIYTRDGHMSVQIMYPESDATLTNDYVLNGYEASFGSFDINEQAHTVTHHVEGSITRGLVGKRLTRAYRFSARRLTIRSTNPNEHWSVIWQHD
ncbi:MAG TPA: lipocalin-like domain-containing protein [Terracidiphilus sp.]